MHVIGCTSTIERESRDINWIVNENEGANEHERSRNVVRISSKRSGRAKQFQPMMRSSMRGIESPVDAKEKRDNSIFDDFGFSKKIGFMAILKAIQST